MSFISFVKKGITPWYSVMDIQVWYRENPNTLHMVHLYMAI